MLPLCWREGPGQSGISGPQPTRAKELRRAPGGPSIRPAARNAPVPAGWLCAGPALHHRSALERRPSADRTTHSNEKRLLSSSKSPCRLCRTSSRADGSHADVQNVRLVKHAGAVPHHGSLRGLPSRPSMPVPSRRHPARHAATGKRTSCSPAAIWRSAWRRYPARISPRLAAAPAPGGTGPARSAHRHRHTS